MVGHTLNKPALRIQFRLSTNLNGLALPEQTCQSDSIPPVTGLNRSVIPEQTCHSDLIPPVTDHINLEIWNPVILPPGTITSHDMHPDLSVPREPSLWEHMVIANIDSSAMEREFVEDDWNIDLDEDTFNDNVTIELPPKFADFSDVFDPKNADELPPHRPYDCEIELLPGMSPPFGPIYPLSKDEEKLSLEYLEMNVKRKFIRETRSPAGSPVFFVDKPNEVTQPGKAPQKRLVVNYQGLDKVTKKFRYPLPLISDLLDFSALQRYFPRLTLRSAYNLLRIKEGDEWKTAFRTKYGLFESLVMPFGLANAPAYFQRFVNETFKDMLNLFVVIYLDDFLIFSEDETSHDTHVRAVLQRLRENKLYAKLEKCKFSVGSVKFLGYHIDSNGITCNQDKVKSVLEWPVPQ